jgi:hypothetical protein
MKRYIVFERGQGSKCWTIAFKENGVPGSFHRPELAAAFAETVRARQAVNGMPMEAYIATVELPI